MSGASTIEHASRKDEGGGMKAESRSSIGYAERRMRAARQGRIAYSSQLTASSRERTEGATEETKGTEATAGRLRQAVVAKSPEGVVQEVKDWFPTQTSSRALEQAVMQFPERRLMAVDTHMCTFEARYFVPFKWFYGGWLVYALGRTYRTWMPNSAARKWGLSFTVPI